jgi:hypothetical protein
MVSAPRRARLIRWHLIVFLSLTHQLGTNRIPQFLRIDARSGVNLPSSRDESPSLGTET